MTTLSSHKPAKTLTVEEVNEFLKDWFVRDGDTFTRITEEQRLSWEPTDTSAYSTFLLGTPTKDYVIRNAYAIARSMLVAMNLPKFSLHISSRNCTDGKNIWVSTEVFDNPSVNTPDAVDVFLGFCAHEGAHILYTDFTVKPSDKYTPAECKFIHNLANILEDERIEIILGEERPGTIRFLEHTKYYVFDMLRDSMVVRTDVVSRVFNTICNIIRYPRYLTYDDINFLADVIEDIKKTVTPYPTDSIEVYKASENIYDLLRPLINQELEEQFKEATARNIEFERLIDELVEHIKKIVPNTATTDARQRVNESKDLGYETDKVLNGQAEEYVGTIPTYFYKTEPDVVEYNKSLDIIRPYIQQVRKKLQYHSKDFKILHKSMRSGYLDTNKLVDAYLGAAHVYEQTGLVKTDKVAVCFIVDQSGSMGGSSIISARDTAILLYEALSNNPSLELFIYGHTADISSEASTNIYVYTEKGGKKDKYKLGSIRAIANNRDGHAIKQIATRIRTITKKPCLMFLLSDGNPNAEGYEDEVGIEDTRKQALAVKKLDFEVVQIAINHSVSPEKMFDKFMVFDNLSTLPANMGKLLKDSLLTKQKIQIT